MKNKRIAAIILFIVLGSLSVSYAEDVIRIGVPLPLTGKFKEFGIVMKNSFEMAQEFVNQNGGINGKPVKIVFSDDKGEEDTAEAVLKSLSNTVMLVGGYASNPTYRMAKLADGMDKPFLICTASADSITRKGWKNIYRLNPPISEYTNGLEDFWIKNLRPRSMAIIYENSMFGTEGTLRMIEFCQDNAIHITMHTSYDRSNIDSLYFRSLLAPLTDEPPDVIYMISYLEDAVLLIRQVHHLKIPSMLAGGAGGFTMEEFVKRTGDNAKYFLTAALWSSHVPYPGAEAYFNSYIQRYGVSPDYHGAEAYSALLVAADALKRASSFSPGDIRKALNDTYMKTPFGPVKFYTYNDFERQNSVKTLVLQIINGKFETVWPPEVASSRFILLKDK